MGRSIHVCCSQVEDRNIKDSYMSNECILRLSFSQVLRLLSVRISFMTLLHLYFYRNPFPAGVSCAASCVHFLSSYSSSGNYVLCNLDDYGERVEFIT